MAEIDQRFEFGKNWRRFLNVVNEDRIEESIRNIRNLLKADSLTGKTFLDVGSGSGLSSLAARRLGASVVSFDYDWQSVACTLELRRRYFPDDGNWRVEQGSILDKDYLQSLGQFDIVYSWGVLHHTGNMRLALENVSYLVAPGGHLFIAIYNDQGVRSKIWMAIKKLYNRLPPYLQSVYVVMVMLPLELVRLLFFCVLLRPGLYLERWTKYHRSRGMSRWYDMVDWVGGYPFEVAKPEEICKFYREKGFQLVNLRTVSGGSGNNQYVFRCSPSAAEARSG